MALQSRIIIDVNLSTAEAQKEAAKLTQEIEGLKVAQKELDKTTEAGALEYVKLSAKIKANTQQLASYQRQIIATTRAEQEENGSLNQLRAKLNEVTNAYDRMSANQRESTFEGKALKSQLDLLTNSVKSLEQGTERYYRSVGDYPNTIPSIKAQIEALKELNQTLDINSKEFEQNSNQIEKLQLKLNVASGKVDEFGDRVKRSAAAENLDRVNDAGAGAAASLSLFALATTGATEQSKEEAIVMQALSAAVGVYTIAKGRKAALELLDEARTKAATLAQLAYTAVMGSSAVATNALTVALRLLRLAIAATGIGAIVIALYELAFNTDQTVESLERFNKKIGVLKYLLPTFGLQKLGEVIQYVKKATDDTVVSTGQLADGFEAQRKQADLLTAALDKRIQQELDQRALAAGGARDIQRQIDLAKAQGASEQTLFDLQQKLNAQKKKDISDQIIALGNLAKEYTGNFELQKDITVKILKLDQDRLDIENQNTIARIDLLKKEAEAKAKLYQDLLAIENTILADDYQYKLNQIDENFAKEFAVLTQNYQAKLITEDRYNKDVIALRANANTELINLNRVLFDELAISQQAGYDKLFEQQGLQEQRSLDLAKMFIDEQKAAQLSLVDTVAAQTQQQATITADFIQGVGDLIGQSLIDTEFDIKKFNKQLVILTLDAVQKVLLAKQAEAIGSIIAAAAADPTNFLTGGAAGLAKAVAFTGVIQGLFAIAKAGISRLEQGGTIPKAANGLLYGPRHSQGGIPAYGPGGAVELEGGEAVINRKSTKAYLPLLSAINEAGGGVKFANGGLPSMVASSLSTPIIDYNQLAEALAAIPAPVVSVEEITTTQNKVNVIQSKSTI